MFLNYFLLFCFFNCCFCQEYLCLKGCYDICYQQNKCNVFYSQSIIFNNNLFSLYFDQKCNDKYLDGETISLGDYYLLNKPSGIKVYQDFKCEQLIAYVIKKEGCTNYNGTSCIFENNYQYQWDNNDCYGLPEFSMKISKECEYNNVLGYFNGSTKLTMNLYLTITLIILCLIQNLKFDMNIIIPFFLLITQCEARCIGACYNITKENVLLGCDQVFFCHALKQERDKDCYNKGDDYEKLSFPLMDGNWFTTLVKKIVIDLPLTVVAKVLPIKHCGVYLNCDIIGTNNKKYIISEIFGTDNESSKQTVNTKEYKNDPLNCLKNTNGYNRLNGTYNKKLYYFDLLTAPFNYVLRAPNYKLLTTNCIDYTVAVCSFFYSESWCQRVLLP